jgi:Tfp pilus assembly protein PilN
MVRFLELPAAAKKSFAEAVALQVEMYKPSDNEPFDWDTTVLEETGHLATTLLFAPRATVEKFANLFSQAGYPLTRLTVTQFSLVHTFLRTRQESQTQRYLLLDYKDVDAELALLEGSRLVYSRSFPVSSETTATVSEVRAQIQQAFSSLRWKESDNLRILLTGDVPELVQASLASFGLVERLPEKISLPGFPPALPDLERYTGAAAVAVSNLTQRRRLYCLNLLPAELRSVRNRLRYLPTYALLAANVLLLLAIGFRSPVQDYVLLRQYRKEIASIHVHAGEMKQLLQTGRTMRQELQAFDTFQQRGRQPLEALNEIALKLPPDAWINTFSSKKRQVEVSGSAKAASPLLPLFQSSSQFQDVKFMGALSQDSSGAERFHLQMRLKEKP